MFNVFSVGKESVRTVGDGFDPYVGKIPWRRKWQTIPIFLPGKTHREGRLAGKVHGVANQT